MKVEKGLVLMAAPANANIGIGPLAEAGPPAKRRKAGQASPSVSNITPSSASFAFLPAQTTNWKAWK